MNNTIKIIIAVLLLTAVFTREKIYRHLGFGQVKANNEFILTSGGAASGQDTQTNDYFIDDYIYHWDEQFLNWIPIQDVTEYQAKLVKYDGKSLLNKRTHRNRMESINEYQVSIEIF